MSKCAAALLVLFLMGGCAKYEHPDFPVVSFTETDAAGRKVRQLQVGLTAAPAKTCIAGDWKVVEVIRDEAGYTKNPAYTLVGGKLEVLLINSFCDSYNSYIGTLSGSSFSGEHVIYGLGTSKNLGSVSGAYSRP